MASFGGNPSPHLDKIANAFCKESPRRGEGAVPPPQLPSADDFHPLPSVLTGASLVNKATQIVHEARKKLEELTERPGISALPLYASLPEAGLRALCEAMNPIWVATDSAVIQQGAEGTEAYIVARGELEARRRRGDQQFTLARLKNGALFGEMALLSRAPRTGSVVALRPSLIVEIKREALDVLAKNHPEVATEIAAHCRERMFQNLVRMSDVMRVVPERDRPVLVQRFQVRTFEKSERLVVQDEEPTGIYLVASGEVAVMRHEGDAEGADDPLFIKTLGPGDVVGEVAMILRRKSNCEVVALHPTVALYLPKGDFMGLIHDHPSILAELYLLAVTRDEETSSIIEEEAAEVTDFTIV
jgi:CRP-like cAMP-binding protein